MLCQGLADGMVTVADIVATWIEIMFARHYTKVEHGMVSVA